MEIKPLNIENSFFIDYMGNFYYYSEYEELGDYSGHSLRYIRIFTDRTNYKTYWYEGDRNTIEIYDGGPDSEPSDPLLLELDICS